MTQAQHEGMSYLNDCPTKFECSVCLQTCIHPVQLPCKHIFCFLCVKGAANRSKRCALCRQEIPQDYFNDPLLLENLKPDDVQFDDGYQWFYEGRNGWWQYDERTSVDLEGHFKSNDKTVELLVAGFLYVIDFENMIQYRRNDPTRRRRVKRDLIASTVRKGIAGLKVERPIVEGDGNLNTNSTTHSSATTCDNSNTDSSSVNASDITPQHPLTNSTSPETSVTLTLRSGQGNVDNNDVDDLTGGLSHMTLESVSNVGDGSSSVDD